MPAQNFIAEPCYHVPSCIGEPSTSLSTSPCPFLIKSSSRSLQSASSVSSTKSTDGAFVFKPSAKQCLQSPFSSALSPPSVVSFPNVSKPSMSTGHSNTDAKSTRLWEVIFLP